ncbi:hypothetical protein K490DRAFT_62820 [Saccharata proteae CBS 121410]|uniref:ER lumen protein retaining receptor n=1 Tax=Saccharata proteae CBS 121410 TaxID=1314787 RepID=A0A9P4HYM7_9PEZI|nr:hypothetical protein K490DRAFT_62820 [Saccharata proteae CBS 121410]
MGFNFNIFRILGDLSHAASHLILIWVIHSNRSAEGVSLLTQILYMVVFSTRYLDIFWTSSISDWHAWWNFCGKILFLTTSAYVIFLMTRVFARTRERELGGKLAIWAFGGSLAAAPLVTLIFRKWGHRFTFGENLWTFSIILESVCVLPQLLLLRQTNVPTVLDSFYLVTLGSYRAFYILNWIVRGFSAEHDFDPIRTIFGILQTALYIDFAWVYWTRQRVKLRAGGVVDSEDLSRGWLVGRVLGRRSTETASDDYDEEAADGADRIASNKTSRWGDRGVALPTDDAQASKPLADPGAFEDEISDDEPEPTTVHKGHETNGDIGVSNGAEWREEH